MAALGFGAGKVWKGGEKGRSEILQNLGDKPETPHAHH